VSKAGSNLSARNDDRQRRWRLSAPAGRSRLRPQLARAGHDVHVYERYAKAGGLLRYGIPDFKMEKDLVDMRVAQMEAKGCTFTMAPTSAPTVPVTELDAYDAIALTAVPKNHAICQLRAVSSTASISRWIFCRSRIARSAANRWATWLPFWPRTNASS